MKEKENEMATKRQVAVSIQTIKEAIMSKPLKTMRILSDWLVKWAIFLRREDGFRPQSLKAYKQREIILVDFGFNVGSEFGGRHYAVVLEKNNNPRSSVILVAPISSYDAQAHNRINPSSVDLGIAAINHSDTTKGNFVVMNQIRTISKLRIESPRTSQESRKFMEKSKFMELLEKLNKKLTP